MDFAPRLEFPSLSGYLFAAFLLASLGSARPSAADSVELMIALVDESVGSKHGYSVATAGDVNGDTFADLIVGAPGNNAAGLNAGRVYVYFGGPAEDAVADLVFTGEYRNKFGIAVGTAGDFNGDTYDDVIVGTDPQSVAGVPGRAYVYFGGPGADSTADLFFSGTTVGDAFGYSVGSAGDVNGDTYDDLIIGAFHDNTSGSATGRAYVYFGGPGFDATADLVLTGEVTGDEFGISVGSAGDVNGDSYVDLIVGAKRNDGGCGNCGRAYVYFGGPTVDSTADLVLDGLSWGSGFGADVAGTGDVNNDGYDDVIVAAPLYEAYMESYRGAAYVFFGGAAPDAAHDLFFQGSTTQDNLGSAVGAAGDMNGDGADDFLVGAYWAENGAGCAYVHLGGAAVDSIPDFVLTGEGQYSYYGFAAATAGDMDGDGRDEIVVGAWGNDEVGTNAGKAYVYSLVGETSAVVGSSPLAELTLSSPMPNPRLGGGGARFAFHLPRAARVRLSIVDVLGRVRGSRPPKLFPAGASSVDWDPGPLPSGTYFVRLEIEGGRSLSTPWVTIR